MKFIKDIFVLLKDTTWPNRKERWKNFILPFFCWLVFFFRKNLGGTAERMANVMLNLKKEKEGGSCV